MEKKEIEELNKPKNFALPLHELTQEDVVSINY